MPEHMKPHEVEENIEIIEESVESICERNARVEADKAWETSLTRRFLIAVMTYIVAGFYMSFIDVSNPWAGAFIPTGGYLFSTLSLPAAKRLWLGTLYRR